MGLRDLLGGNGTRVRSVSLQEGETEICREVACVRPGTLTSLGGELVLTDRRLVFCPQQTKDRADVLTWVLRTPGAPPPGLPDRFGELVQQRDVPAGARGVVSVSADGGGWLKSPTILVRGTDGSTTEIGVLAGRRSMNRDRNNVVARDRMLAAIQAVLTP